MNKNLLFKSIKFGIPILMAALPSLSFANDIGWKDKLFNQNSGITISVKSYRELDENNDKIMSIKSSEFHYFRNDNLINFPNSRMSMNLKSDLYGGLGHYVGSDIDSSNPAIQYGSYKQNMQYIGAEIMPNVNYQINDKTNVYLGVNVKNEYQTLNNRYYVTVSPELGISTKQSVFNIPIEYGFAYQHAILNKYRYPNLVKGSNALWLDREGTQKFKVFVEQDDKYGLELSYQTSKSSLNKAKTISSEESHNNSESTYFEPKDKQIGLSFYYNFH